MSYEPLHHKYRPQTFAALVGQDAIATTLTNAIKGKKIAPAYLFTGPRGTGKTSSARILAKSLNCLKSSQPTEQPCGVCEVCKGITNGSALDVIEIDAASNTGVDNIREIIERAQFAPVQCRYKVYVIDECLTGDSLVQTSEGLIRIDDPNIKGKKVLSYNDFSKTWELKKVVRWLDQGKRQVLVIKTTNREIRCTANHLIRTESGWIAAKDIREGAKILSPVNVAVEPLSTELGPMDALGDLSEDTSSRVIHTDRSYTTWLPSSSRLNPFDLSALVDVVKSLTFQAICSRKVMELRRFSHAGKSIHTERDTESGSFVQKSSLPMPKFWNQTHLGLSTELCLETVPSVTQINIVDSLDWLGLMGRNSGNGWSTKPIDYGEYSQQLKSHLTKDTEICQFAVAQPVILNFEKFLMLLNRMGRQSLSPWTGLIESLLKDLLGGIWMMAHSRLAQKEVHLFKFIRKDIPLKKTKSLPIGLRQRDIHQQQSFIKEGIQVKSITTQEWAQIPVGSGWQTSDSIPSLAWNTSLEQVESVKVAGIERVYDLEIEENHNFVANGLLVHNCHMLSTAAFNALLKTLEEPPEHVVFILATTDLQRVLPTIISRCQRFDFRRIALEPMMAHLNTIASKENINITPEAVQLVAQLAQGGLRDAESLLDQLSLLSSQVTVDRVWDLVGCCSEPDLMQLLAAIAANNPEALLECARLVMDRGREPLTILQNLAGFYRDLLIAKTAPNRNDLVTITSSTWQHLTQLGQSWDVNAILAGQQHLAKSEIQIKTTTQPHLWLEVTLLGLLSQQQPQQSVALKNNAASKNVNEAQPKPQPPAKEKLTPPLAEPISISNTPPAVEPISLTAQPTETISEALSPPQTKPEEIWQQVLAHLEPVSTREMLRQLGRLIAFDGTVARVSIAQKWHKKISEKILNIEAAFQKTLNCRVKVIFEAATSTQTSTKSQLERRGDRERRAQPDKGTIDEDSPAALTYLSLPDSLQSTSSNQPQVMDRSETVMTAKELTDSPILELPTLDAATDTSTIAADSESEVTKAAQRLADFFKGEFVKDPDFPATTYTLPEPIASPLTDWNEADAEDEIGF